MKTLTEFSVFTLKKAHTVASSLTKDETFDAKFQEALGLDADKASRMQSALEAVGGRFENLKRVLVLQGEKAPEKALEKDGLFFLAEYYPPLEKKRGPNSPQDKDKGRRPRKKGGPRTRQHDGRAPKAPAPKKDA